jgi:hypothetical protein
MLLINGYLKLTLGTPTVMLVATSVGSEYSGLENFTKKKGGGEKRHFVRRSCK